MAAGMMLVIVARHIDLSVGSILGVVGMIMGVTQAEFLPRYLGFGHPLIWIVALAVGLAVGAAIGLLQGVIVAYLGVPAFIVTLGGLLVWRGCAWWITSGRTVAPMDDALPAPGRRHRGLDRRAMDLGGGAAGLRRHRLARAPRATEAAEGRVRGAAGMAEVACRGLACLAVLGVVLVANSYDLPPRVAERLAAARGIAVPPQGPVDRPRSRRAGVDRRRGGDRRQLPCRAHALRPLCVCARRQSRGGRAVGVDTRRSPCWSSC